MTTTAPRPSFIRLVFTDIADLIASQPQQALMSIASVTIVAGEAGHMVPVPAAIALAVGAEWGYLRGIASSSRGSRVWTRTLNASNMGLVLIYGLLYGARTFGADPEAVFGPWLLTLLHIVPIVLVSMAAAMVHRSAVEAEAADATARVAAADERQRRLEAEEDERQRERQRRLDELEANRLARLAEVDAWEALTAAKQRVKQVSTRAVAEPASNASGTDMNSVREQIANTLHEHPNTNKSELAKQLGISRTKLYALIKEVREGRDG